MLFICCSSDSCLSPVLFCLQCIVDVVDRVLKIRPAAPPFSKSISVKSPLPECLCERHFINGRNYIIHLTRAGTIHAHTLTLRKWVRHEHGRELAAATQGACSWDDFIDEVWASERHSYYCMCAQKKKKKHIWLNSVWSFLLICRGPFD